VSWEIVTNSPSKAAESWLILRYLLGCGRRSSRGFSVFLPAPRAQSSGDREKMVPFEDAVLGEAG